MNIHGKISFFFVIFNQINTYISRTVIWIPCVMPWNRNGHGIEIKYIFWTSINDIYAYFFTYMLVISLCMLELMIASQILELLRLIFVCNVISRRHCFHHSNIDTNFYTLMNNFLNHVNLDMKKPLPAQYPVTRKRLLRSYFIVTKTTRKTEEPDKISFLLVRKDCRTVPHSKQNNEKSYFWHFLTLSIKTEGWAACPSWYFYSYSHSGCKILWYFV